MTCNQGKKLFKGRNYSRTETIHGNTVIQVENMRRLGSGNWKLGTGDWVLDAGGWALRLGAGQAQEARYWRLLRIESKYYR